MIRNRPYLLLLLTLPGIVWLLVDQSHPPVAGPIYTAMADTLYFSLQVSTGRQSLQYGEWRVDVYPEGSGRVALGKVDNSILYLPAGTVDLAALRRHMDAAPDTLARHTALAVWHVKGYPSSHQQVDPIWASAWLYQLIHAGLAAEPSPRRVRHIRKLLQAFPPLTGDPGTGIS